MTRRDLILARVLLYTQQGWPEHMEYDDLKPYFNRKEELSVQDGCIFWVLRLIIPNLLRLHVLELLHETHPGIS